MALIVVPGIAFAGPGASGGADDDAQMVADAMRTESAVAAAYNDKKWDELATMYTEDAVAMPPNHEPVRGRDAIIEYFRSVRDVYASQAAFG
jgi:ketosteroid isomerase-like protein